MCGLTASLAQAEIPDSLLMDEVVVTGTRNATDVRHLPMTVTVIGRDRLTVEHQPSVLPTVMREVPGLFLTSRAMMGYGVSTGAAGGINLRGIAGGAGQLINELSRGRFSSTVAAQYNRSDNHRPRMGFEQYGGYLKMNYYMTENWNAYVDANVTHFNASYPGSTDKPLYDADQWITRGVVSAAVENHYGNRRCPSMASRAT